VKKGDGCSERVVVDRRSVQRRWQPQQKCDGWGDNSEICCDQFNVNIIIYQKIQLEDAIIDGGIIVKFQLLPSSSELEKSDKLLSDE
jgi:hypothetical protein